MYGVVDPDMPVLARQAPSAGVVQVARDLHPDGSGAFEVSEEGRWGAGHTSHFICGIRTETRAQLDM